MNLVNHRISYNTLELLQSMMKVSKVHILNKNHTCNHMSYGHYLTEICIPKFSLGRQTGKSESILEYSLARAKEGKRTIVVVPNTLMKRQVGDIASEYPEVHYCTASGSFDDSSNFGFGDVEVIFDECSNEEASVFIERNLHSACVNVVGLVSVGNR